MTGNQITKGRNLLNLFNLGKASSVLILGEGCSAWKDIFPQAQYCPSIRIITEGTDQFDLILLDGSAAETASELEDVLAQVRQRISEQGVLFLLAGNLFSFERIKRLIKTGALKKEKHLYRYDQIMKIVARTSFPHLQIFLPFPGDDNDQRINEMIAPDSRFLEVPYYQHPIKRFAHSLGKYHLMHDRFAVLCMHKPLLQNALFKKIRKALYAVEESGEIGLRLEKCDIRDRGALVLFIKWIQENISSAYLVARVVHGPETKEIIERNHKYLVWLQNMEKLPDAVKKKIPQPLAEFSFQEGHVFVETLIPGILAWKVNNRKIKNKIYEDSMQFIFNFSMLTRQNKFLDEKILDELFIEDERIINESKTCSGFLKKILSEEIACIKDTIAGQHIWLAASHGDYGYGNIMVDPSTGNLKGVIDWDTARYIDFPAIDLINMEIQRRRIEQKMSIAEALNDVMMNYSKHSEKYERYFKIDYSLFVVLAHISLVRDISRSLKYPALYLKGQEEQIQAMHIIKKKYPITAQ